MMQEPSNEYVPITETKAVRLAQFFTAGDWHYHSHFALIGRVTKEDGVWKPVQGSWQGADEQGEVYGFPVGELFQCFKCGASIQYHYAIQDRKTGRIVNLGMECIERFYEGQENSVEYLKIKGMESLKRKIRTDFKRNVNHNQMVEFLKANLDTLEAPNRKSVAEKLEKNPEHFWKSETYIKETATKRFEIKRTKWERTQNAEKDLNAELKEWEQYIDKYERMSWNPKTMQPEIQKMITKAGFDIVVPALRKLTDAESKAMNKQMFIEVEEYEKRVNQK